MVFNTFWFIEANIKVDGLVEDIMKAVYRKEVEGRYVRLVWLLIDLIVSSKCMYILYYGVWAR